MDKSIGVTPGPWAARPGKGPLALIIEDNPSQAAYIAALLESIGYGVDFASDGAMGLAKVAQVRPALVLLDLNMPRFDGLGFLQRFRKQADFAEFPVIVITASQSIDTITKVCAMGARDFIPKPIDAKVLIEKVTKHARAR
jgi:DNA-binding response OmpR family regulator